MSATTRKDRPMPETCTGADVVVTDVPARCTASIRFSGMLSSEAGEAERQSLAAWIDERGLEHDGDWQMAGYNPPWTVPMLRRNEVLVTLASCP